MKTKVLLLLMCLLLTSCGGIAQDDDYDNSDDYYDETHNITRIDTDSFYGIYMPEDESSNWNYIDIHDDGTWHLYGYDSELTGWLGYDDEYEAEYAYNDSDGSGSRFYITDDGRLYFAEYGYFYYSGMDNMWYDNGEISEENQNQTDNYVSPNGDEYYSWNSELYQRNVSEFEGVWYYDGDLSAETYITIDGDGNWGYYQRAPGTEAAEMDYGYLTYSEDEHSTYYAVSELYDGVTFKVFEFDQDMLVWGEVGTYYLMEK